METRWTNRQMLKNVDLSFRFLIFMGFEKKKNIYVERWWKFKECWFFGFFFNKKLFKNTIIINNLMWQFTSLIFNKKMIKGLICVFF